MPEGHWASGVTRAGPAGIGRRPTSMWLSQPTARSKVTAMVPSAVTCGFGEPGGAHDQAVCLRSIPGGGRSRAPGATSRRPRAGRLSGWRRRRWWQRGTGSLRHPVGKRRRSRRGARAGLSGPRRGGPRVPSGPGAILASTRTVHSTVSGGPGRRATVRGRAGTARTGHHEALDSRVVAVPLDVDRAQLRPGIALDRVEVVGVTPVASVFEPAESGQLPRAVLEGEGPVVVDLQSQAGSVVDGAPVVDDVVVRLRGAPVGTAASRTPARRAATNSTSRAGDVLDHADPAGGSSERTSRAGRPSISYPRHGDGGQ